MKQSRATKNNKIINFVKVNQKKILLVLGLVLMIYCFFVKASVATKLGHFADEPDDFGIIVEDSSRINTFFDNVPSADQSRLPHVVSLPIIMLFGVNSLVPLRIFHIFMYMGYIYVLYKLFRLTLSRVKAFYGVILTSLSCYMFSFSVFTMTTSNTLSFLLGALFLYLYIKYTKNSSSTKLSANQLVILGVISGMAVGSRFFSAILIVSALMFDVFLCRKALFKNFTWRIWELPFLIINMSFFILLTIINVVHLLPIFKIFLALILVIYYVVFLYGEFLHNKPLSARFGFISRWLILGSTAVASALISSPIHLNYENIVRIFEWGEIWHKVDNFINPSRFDIFTITGFKLGLFAGVMILISLFVIFYRKQQKDFFKKYALLIIVTILHFIIFVWAKYVLTWYPLFIMPFMYLPLIYVFPDKLNELKKPLMAVFCALLIALPIYEQYRYLRLFPFGQMDGAQYGKQYIGWNKPGMITFESIKDFIDYLKTHPEELPKGPMECNLIKSSQYKKWTINLMNYKLQKAGVDGYNCLPEDTKQVPMYVITSIYTPESEIDRISQSYKTQKETYQSNVKIGTFWVKK